jgi:hypothetical protein
MHDWVRNEQDKMQDMRVYSRYHFRNSDSKHSTSPQESFQEYQTRTG